MKQSRNSIDGFIPRRAGSEIGDLHVGKNPASVDRSLHTDPKASRDFVGTPREGKEMTGQNDITESLREIDAVNSEQKPSRRAQRKLKKRQRKQLRKKGPLWRKILKWVSLLLLVGLVAGIGFVVFRAITAGNNVFDGNIFDIVQNEPLQQDANGRSNFIIFGTAEDSEGGQHEGGNLTDSLMVVSIDQNKKDAYLLSLPRDLWVQYEEQCFVGDYGKLNAAYFCGSNDGEDEAAGAAALQRKVSEITGLDVQYYVHLNFTAVTEAVDAVGGVTVTIETDDPRGILDRNFDWKCNYTCYYVRYDQGEVVQLDGERALALARARNAAGGYGLAGGNFDREQNQQKILRALVEKASSAGTLTNVGAVTGLLDAIGNNLRTNIETKEIRTLMALGNDIDPNNIISLSLVDEENFLVTTGNISGQSIVQPVAGVFDYSEIQRYIDRAVTANPVVREESQITVLNGGRAAGVAGAESDRLEDEGFIVNVVSNAPDGTYGRVEIYQLTEEKPASVARLEQLYSTTVLTTDPPVSVVGESDFVIILGPEQ
jgi:polyisoprenyl-teichoic acid--peptidoglycan teichoic acid transferase